MGKRAAARVSNYTAAFRRWRRNATPAAPPGFIYGLSGNRIRGPSKYWTEGPSLGEWAEIFAPEASFATLWFVEVIKKPASTNGSLNVGNTTLPTSFTATGIDYGYAIGLVSYDINAAYN